VEVSDEEIKDFRDRLTRVRFPPAMEEEVNLTYGFPSHALPGLRDSMLSLDLHKWAVKVYVSPIVLAQLILLSLLY